MKSDLRMRVKIVDVNGVVSGWLEDCVFMLRLDVIEKFVWLDDLIFMEVILLGVVIWGESFFVYWIDFGV